MSARRRHGEVPGMGVGVEDAIVDNHLQVRSLERLGQLRPRDTARVEAVAVVALRAGDYSIVRTRRVE